MFNFPSKFENPVLVSVQLLDLLDISINSSTIKKSLSDHPEYPSLLAISDLFSDHHVKNEAYRVNHSTIDIDTLEFPFIAHFSEMGGQFFVIKSVSGGSVTYLDDKNQSLKMNIQEFRHRWDGILLHANATENSGEKNYNEVYFKDFLNILRIPSAIILFTVAFVLVISNNGFSSTTIISSFIKFLGLSVSILLLINSIDANNPFVKNLCSLGSKNNCNAILKSDASKVFSWLSWSEVGFFYFAGSLLTLLLPSNSASLLAIISLLCLPYSFYSIYYQYKTNNWCILCCSIQLLLWADAITLFYGGIFSHLTFEANYVSYMVILIGFISPVIVWGFLKPFLLESSQSKPLNEQLKRFKFNGELFNQILTAQPRYAVPENLCPITIGNSSAELVITMVSNPFCGPCASAHKLLDEWLSVRDDLKVKFVFATASHDDDPKTKVARHLTALSQVEDNHFVKKALNSWYNGTFDKWQTWAAAYPVATSENTAKTIERQKDWCDMVEITETPTIFINGYKLPEPYRLQDIKYLLN